METKNYEFEIKNINEKGIFQAYASTFGNADLIDDVVQKGAFLKSLQSRPAKDVLMFWQHKSDVIVGEWLSMKEDDHGLLVEGQLFIDDIQQAKEAFFLMKKKLIKKLSIGFQLVKKSFDNGKRFLDEIDLLEVSLVTFPCNEEASILGVKAAEMSEKDFERKLRDAVGLSRSEAKTLMSRGFKALGQRDADKSEKEQQEADEAKFIKLMTGKL